jgi:phospholipid-transporting ATPase
MVRFFQAIYINNDLEMYDAESGTRANARTSNLNEELGQVKFVVTDKTGTLTKNVMKFKRCTVGGVIYGDDTSHKFCDKTLIDNLKSNHVSIEVIRDGVFQESASQIYDFLLAMAICHTVVPEIDENVNNISYQASSPDENALVRGAASQGFIFARRTPQSLTLYAVSLFYL